MIARTRTLAVLAVTLVLGTGAMWPESAAISTAKGTCPVTLPDRIVPPDAGSTAAAFNYGRGRLRVYIYWPHGTLTAGVLPNGGTMATINADGSMRAKVAWWRGVRGKLAISGRRLYASAPPLLTYVPSGYGPVGVVPSALTFPTVGCWRVVGKAGRARLTFVVRVRKVENTAGG